MIRAMADSDDRLSDNQALVLKTLRRARRALGAYAILDRLRNDGLKAPPQVYRALDGLMARGLVHRLECLNAYVACRHGDAHGGRPAAFAICGQCGRVEEFCDDEVDRHLAEWAGRRHFDISQTTVEIRGRCGQCC